jgi:hypothetical protein
MNLSMPPTFFQEVFQEFARFAGNLFPGYSATGTFAIPFKNVSSFRAPD